MERCGLGSTGMAISRLGLGTWAFGGGEWAFGWGPQDDADSVATLLRATELGVNWIDTAPVYGLGHAESVVGRALSRLAPADRPYVFTKCGLGWSARGKLRHSLSRTSLRDEVEASLRRLAIEAIDLYQIHWPVYPPDRPATDLEEGWDALARMKEDGKVRHIGVSNFDVGHLERVRAVAPVESLQPPYSLIRRDPERELFPYCEANRIPAIVYSPLGSGLLSGRFTRDRVATLPATDWRKSKSLDFREPALSRHLVVAERVRALAAQKTVAPAALAVRWTLGHPAVTGAIVGARRPEQLDEVVEAPDVHLTEAEASGLSG